MKTNFDCRMLCSPNHYSTRCILAVILWCVWAREPWWERDLLAHRCHTGWRGTVHWLFSTYCLLNVFIAGLSKKGESWNQLGWGLKQAWDAKKNCLYSNFHSVLDSFLPQFYHNLMLISSFFISSPFKPACYCQSFTSISNVLHSCRTESSRPLDFWYAKIFACPIIRVWKAALSSVRFNYGFGCANSSRQCPTVKPLIAETISGFMFAFIFLRALIRSPDLAKKLSYFEQICLFELDFCIQFVTFRNL